MRILVTGAAGFVGSVVALRAKELGHEVIAIDSYERGLNAGLLARHGLTVHEVDCRFGVLGTGLVEDIDATVHLAAGTGSLARPLEELLEVNKDMALRVLKDSRAAGSKTFVWPTTSLALAVPDSPYVESKEQALEALRMHDDVIPLRFFNVTGSYKGLTERRKNEVHLIPKMLEAQQASERFSILGNDYETHDGTPSRDFVNVVDVADGVLTLLRKPQKMFQARERDLCVWFGTGRTTTVLDAVEIVEQYVGPLPVTFEKRRAFDCGELRCDSRALETIIERPLVPPHVSIRDEALALSWATR